MTLLVVIPHIFQREYFGTHSTFVWPFRGVTCYHVLFESMRTLKRLFTGRAYHPFHGFDFLWLGRCCTFKMCCFMCFIITVFLEHFVTCAAFKFCLIKVFRHMGLVTLLFQFFRTNLTFQPFNLCMHSFHVVGKSTIYCCCIITFFAKYSFYNIE